MAEARILIPEELNPKLDITLVIDSTGLNKAREYLRSATVFCYDVETNITEDFTTQKIRTIQFGDKSQQFVIDLLPFAQAAGKTLEEAMLTPYRPDACLAEIVDVIREALESHTIVKIGHNIQFDYEKTKYCLGIRMRGMYCTMLNEKLIYAGLINFNSKGFWALDDLVLRRLGLIMSKEAQKTFDLVTPITDFQITYCALDARLPMGLYTSQFKTLEADGLLRVSGIENRAISAFGDMYLNGIGIDKRAWLKVVHRYKKAHKRNIAKLDEFFIPIVGKKDFDDSHLAELERIWREDDNKETRAAARKDFMAARKIITHLKKNYSSYQGQAAVNYASPVSLYNILKELPKFVEANIKNDKDRKLPKFKGTDDRTLHNFAEHPSWDLAKAEEEGFEKVGMIDALRLYRETEKLLNGYGTDWLRKHVNKTTGRVHGKLNQLGADTGRTSCSRPNMQQLPRGHEWRSCFIARPGNKIITMDLSGAELVILAELSQDPIFVHAYRNGWDVHSVVAELVFGDEWKDAAEPNCAYYNSDHKKCSCKGHKKLRTKAKPIGLGTAYGMMEGKLADTIHVEHSEAATILKQFYDKFKVLIAYLEKSGNDAKEKLESRSASGRRRLFTKPLYRDGIAKAKKKMEEKGIKDKMPDARSISWALKAMYSAIEREGKNNPLQASNADISKIWMGEDIIDNVPMMASFLEDKYEAMLVMFVHDETVVEVPERFAEDCDRDMNSAAVKASASLLSTVPMGTESDIKTFWKK